MESLDFKGSLSLSMGVELELQLINLSNSNLTSESTDLLRRIKEIPHTGDIKPEIAQSMIELNSSVHNRFSDLLTELTLIRSELSSVARQANIGICGGGAHPFQSWNEQRIYPTERFSEISEEYGYLAKQFTVFGQHIHIGVPSGDDAIYLCHAMALFIPHFIALSASSPFYQGVDTAFDCARLVAISAFPLSGTPPWLHSLTWQAFQDYFEKMRNLEIIKSMKDFYWDIRPKPEYGTIELRVCDTPLTIEKAALLAAYMQMLVRFLMDEKPQISRDVYLSYTVNRFRACRYGLRGLLIDPLQGTQSTIAHSILHTLNRLENYAIALSCTDALATLREFVLSENNDANWLRQQMTKYGYLPDVVQAGMELWNK